MKKLFRNAIIIFVALVIISSCSNTSTSTSNNENHSSNAEALSETYYAYHRIRSGKGSSHLPTGYLLLSTENNRVYRFTENSVSLAMGSFTGDFKNGITVTFDDGYSFELVGSKNQLSTVPKDSDEKEWKYGLTDTETVLAALDVVKDNIAKLTNYESKFEGVCKIVEYGAYEQDASIDGVEPIKWLVLKEENGQSLLLSLYILDFLKYDDPEQIEAAKKVSWYEDSFIRKWLNTDFYDNAFSDYEKQFILSVTRTRKHPQQSEEVTSTDSVLLLEWNDYKELFDSYEYLMACTLDRTTSIIGNGKNGFYEYLTCTEKSESIWFTVGSPSVAQGTVDYDEYVGIRPAIVVDSSALD